MDLSQLNLPKIDTLNVSSPGGNILQHALDLGGFGISRFALDYQLSIIAKTNGVSILENSRVEDVQFGEDRFTIRSKTNFYFARVVAGTFGKRSNLDIKWQRSFIKKRPGKLNNYIGVKYHVKSDHPANTIALHNFKEGYCGISKIEDNKYCLCYLTTAQNLKDNKNLIPEMEKNVLHKNPYLKRIFTTSDFLFDSPVVISQISFDRKKPVENHILMIGDASGMITPLCGNGMSMALHASKLAYGVITTYLENKISRSDMEHLYEKQWKHQFLRRLWIGRLIQNLFGKETITNLFLRLLKPFPTIINKLIKATHGDSF